MHQQSRCTLFPLLKWHHQGKKIEKEMIKQLNNFINNKKNLVNYINFDLNNKFVISRKNSKLTYKKITIFEMHEK